MTLTSTHEDYIELVYRMQKKNTAGLRITDLAQELGCRLPTVTRTVKLLAESGYLEHQPRGLVLLTAKGSAIASQIAHRHDDIETFLELVLGLTTEQAKIDACKIEHGLSPIAAERLHAFLEYIESLPNHQRKEMQETVKHHKENDPLFDQLVETTTQGWRR